MCTLTVTRSFKWRVVFYHSAVAFLHTTYFLLKDLRHNGVTLQRHICPDTSEWPRLGVFWTWRSCKSLLFNATNVSWRVAVDHILIVEMVGEIFDFTVLCICKCCAHGWSNLLISITFGMLRSASLLESYRLTVTQYVGTIPEFPYSPRCLQQRILLTVLTCVPPYTRTHTLKDVWHQLNHTGGGGTDDWWQVAESTTTDDAQLYRTTFFCDVWDIGWAYRLQQVHEAEGRFKAYKLDSTEFMEEFTRYRRWKKSFFTQGLKQNKAFKVDYCCSTSMSLKIVPALIFTYWAAFLAAPTIGSNLFLLCSVSFTFVLQKIQWDSKGFVAIASHFHRRDPGLWELFGIWSHKPNLMDAVCSPRGPPGCVGNPKSLSVVLERRWLIIKTAGSSTSGKRSAKDKWIYR